MSSRAFYIKKDRSSATPPNELASTSKGGTYAELLEDNSVKVEPIILVDNELFGRCGDNKKEEEDVDTVMGDRSPSSSNLSKEVKDEFSHTKMKEDPRQSNTPPAPSKSKAKPEPQLIGYLPRAEEDARLTFTEIPKNHYQYQTLGRSREALESMTCDCQYDHGVDDPSDACGHGSDCINRLTQVECLPDDCKCRSYCQNQRFQRKQYAPIHIVQTEKKGFGLRAADNIRKDSFIYEYVGDVVSQPSFLKRMRQYAEEGIRHFYFMMLQKDEYIDATKRGGIGRFANHSCSPNCYVAKWTVGEHVRMGIFAHRNIKKDEELTFNYNVDRYGHDAQPCFCGEPNCVGFIGGKTQTDIATMDDLYLDALGITDEDEIMALKGTKKKKGKKLDDDFVPDLKPLVEKDVPKVVQALRQTSTRKLLLKLLTRIKMTEDQSALRQIMRLRGFSVMTNVLEDWNQDGDINILALECMMAWPLMTRNKVEDSKIHVPVGALAQSENETVASLAKRLIAQWESLEFAYRIPKRLKNGNEVEDYSPITFSPRDDDRDRKRLKMAVEYENPVFKLRPLGFSVAPPRYDRKPSPEPFRFPPPTVPVALLEQTWYPKQRPGKSAVETIIADAEEAAAAAQAAAEAEALKKANGDPSKRKASSSKHKKQTAEEKELNKEKRLQKLVGAVVVKCMSKHRDQFDHEQFKRYAKELTQVISDKEKKSSSYVEGHLEFLSDEKMAKIKKFSKEYIHKVLKKLDKKRKESGSNHRDRHKHHSTTSTSTPTEGSRRNGSAKPADGSPRATPGEDDGVRRSSRSFSGTSLDYQMREPSNEDVDYSWTPPRRDSPANGSSSWDV